MHPTPDPRRWQQARGLPKTTAVSCEKKKDHLETALSLMTPCRLMLPTRGWTGLFPHGSYGEITSPSPLLCPTRSVAPLPASVSARFRLSKREQPTDRRIPWPVPNPVICDPVWRTRRVHMYTTTKRYEYL